MQDLALRLKRTTGLDLRLGKPRRRTCHSTADHDDWTQPFGFRGIPPPLSPHGCVGRFWLVLAMRWPRGTAGNGSRLVARFDCLVGSVEPLRYSSPSPGARSPSPSMPVNKGFHSSSPAPRIRRRSSADDVQRLARAARRSSAERSSPSPLRSAPCIDQRRIISVVTQSPFPLRTLRDVPGSSTLSELALLLGFVRSSDPLAT